MTAASDDDDDAAKPREVDDDEEAVYEEVPLERMNFDPETGLFTFDCPCGDVFEIYLDELHDGESIAYCPSCTLKVRVLFDAARLPPLPSGSPERRPDAAPAVAAEA